MKWLNNGRRLAAVRGMLCGIGIVVITAGISPLFFEVEKVLDSWMEHRLYSGMWLFNRPLSYAFFFLQTAAVYGVPSGLGGGILGLLAMSGSWRRVALWSLVIGVVVPLSGAVILALAAFILSGQPHLDKSMLIMHILVMMPLFGFVGQMLARALGKKGG